MPFFRYQLFGQKAAQLIIGIAAGVALPVGVGSRIGRTRDQPDELAGVIVAVADIPGGSAVERAGFRSQAAGNGSIVTHSSSDK